MNLIKNQTIDFCLSTNDLARELGQAGCPHGTWISARQQGLGRGRRGHTWVSEKGNLFVSLIMRIENPKLWTWVPLTTAVALAKTLNQKYLPPRARIEIKWPNDLRYQKRKLGGILCESFSNASQSFIIVGFGLNCVSSPEGLDQKTVSLSEMSGKTITADDLREDLIQEVLCGIGSLSQGIDHVQADYDLLAEFKAGAPVQWKTDDGKLQFGKVHGLGDSGELIVRLADGRQIPLLTEEIFEFRDEAAEKEVF